MALSRNYSALLVGVVEGSDRMKVDKDKELAGESPESPRPALAASRLDDIREMDGSERQHRPRLPDH